MNLYGSCKVGLCSLFGAEQLHLTSGLGRMPAHREVRQGYQEKGKWKVFLTLNTYCELKSHSLAKYMFLQNSEKNIELM